MATISEALAIALQHHQAGRLEFAEQIYRQILAAEPNHADALHLLGVIAHQVGRHDLAIDYINRAIALKKNSVAFHNNLGEAYRALRRIPEAVACYRRALELKPDYAEAHGNLGAALQRQGNLDEATACYRRALELKPTYAEAHNNLGEALKDQGKLDEALACCRRALELQPDLAQTHSNLLYMTHFSPRAHPRTILQEHQVWNQRHGKPLAKFIQPHLNDRSPSRRLRIGYVSPDFRSHPVGRFVLPLLEAHRHEDFEVVCYSSVRVPDTITDRCRARVDVWRNVSACSDEQLAHAIRQDQIDILVDLTMHMADNRLLVFARKPAPIQVTYLAYCGTTGLDTIDYRLTDPYLDPPDDERFYSEQSVRLPETYWCYRPTGEAPEVNAMPALRTGSVTFGCLNNFCKASAPTLLTWCQILRTVPSARLILHAKRGSHRDGVRDVLAQQGVSPDRLLFVDSVPVAEYFRTYAQIDVALDPFPYGGGTTTCDALWMAVPVVSLAGRTALGRAGLSILSNVGLPELVATDPRQYAQIAVRLAEDLPRLSQIRSALRARLQSSPLMDANRFARNVEAAYRTMWRHWCRAGSPTTLT